MLLSIEELSHSLGVNIAELFSQKQLLHSCKNNCLDCKKATKVAILCKRDILVVSVQHKCHIFRGSLFNWLYLIVCRQFVYIVLQEHNFKCIFCARWRDSKTPAFNTYSRASEVSVKLSPQRCGILIPKMDMFGGIIVLCLVALKD